MNSTALVENLGDEQAASVLARVDHLARELLIPHRGREIDRTDGFLHVFDNTLDAVRYALALHRGLGGLSEELDLTLRVRAGIHVGQVVIRENDPAHVARGAKPIEVDGLAKPMTARVMSLGFGGQTLLTRPAFDLTRRAAVGVEGTSDWVWESHGLYRVQGVADPIEVCEIGIAGRSPLRAPVATSKARPVRRRWGAGVAAIALGLGLAAGALWWIGQPTVTEGLFAGDQIGTRFGVRVLRPWAEPIEPVQGRGNWQIRAEDGRIQSARAVTHTGEPRNIFSASPDFSAPVGYGPWSDEHFDRRPTAVITQYDQTWDDTGRLEARTYRDALGHVIFIERADFADPHTFTREFTGPNGRLYPHAPALHDAWSREVVRVDESGLQTLRWGISRDGELANHRHRYVRDEGGLIIADHIEDEDGNPRQHTYGTSRVETVPDPVHPGLVVRERNLAPSGRLAPGAADGCASSDITWDALGRAEETRCFGVDDEPAESFDGCFGLRWSYPSPHRMETVCLGVDGELQLSNSGFGTVTTTYHSESGLTASEAYTDLDGNAVPGPVGIASQTYDWDAYGALALEGFRADKGWQRRQHRDDFGRLARIETLDVDDHPTRDEHGVAIWTFDYDDSGRTKAVRRLGPDGRPTLSTDGVYETAFEYWEDGGVERVSFRGLDGAPTRTAHAGAASIRYAQNGFGDVVERTCFDIDDSPLVCTSDSGFGYENSLWHCHRVRYERDNAGNISSKRCYGIDNEPLAGPRGFHGTDTLYDNAGRFVQTRFIGVDDEPAEVYRGASTVHYTWDGVGQPTEVVYRNRAGEVVAVEGCYRKKSVNDELGRRVEARCIGPDGGSVEAPQICPVLKLTYTNRFDLASLRCEDDAGDLVFKPEIGFARHEFTYLGPGKPLEDRYYDAEGNPARAAFLRGHGTIRWEYDARGREVAKSILDHEDETVRRLDFTLDEQGRIIGQRVTMEGVVESWFRNTLDERGRIVRTDRFGADGELSDERGWAVVTVVYAGDRSIRQYFDETGAPLRQADSGCFGSEQTTDAADRLLRYVCLDPVGKPAQPDRPDRAAERRVERTAGGTPREVSVFNWDGTPMTLGGVHRIVRANDAAGQPVSVAFFDATGGPTVPTAPVSDTERDWPVGNYARATLEYDHNRRLLEQRWFAEDGKPGTGPDGASTVRHVWSVSGDLVRKEALDPDGRPL